MEVSKCIALGKNLCFCFHENQKAVDSFWVDRDQFWPGDTDANPGNRQKTKNATRQHIFYFLKHKTKHHLWLAYVTESLMQICMLRLKVWMFSECGNQVPIQADIIDDPVSQCVSAEASSEFYI